MTVEKDADTSEPCYFWPMVKIRTLIVLLVSLFACKQQTSDQAHVDTTFGIQKLRYAKHFEVLTENGTKYLMVKSPWDPGQYLATYALVSMNDELPKGSLRENALVVRTPVKSVIPLSSTHLGILSRLDLQHTIVAVGESDYVYDSLIRQKITAEKLVEVGLDHNLNIETVLDISPNLVMASGNQKVNSNLRLIEKGGVSVAYNLEWMEQTPLGRAEWIKFVAAFYELGEKAEWLFDQIEREYLIARKAAKEAIKRPRVMLDAPYKGTWYVPGGKSYVAELLRDANIDYPWFEEPVSGSIPLSFEEVLEEEIEAEYWIGPGIARSLVELKDMDERFVEFRSYDSGQVYNQTKRVLPSGANDYWESGVVNPHLILKDYIKITHPELMVDYEFTYYEQLR